MTAETRLEPAEPKHLHPASMGPRSYDRGNSNTGRWEVCVLDLLQWGRGLMTAETPPIIAAAPPGEFSFNGAAVL